VPSAIVAGAIANKPLNGGEAWVRLSWILGLRRLGFEVCFLERLGAATGQAHLEAVLEEFGLGAGAALLDQNGRSLLGLDTETLAAMIGEADVLFDISGHLGRLGIAAAARRRVYVDLDPGFTQAWHLDAALDFSLAGYDDYVTVGLNLGRDGCAIETGGITWIATLPPIVLEHWACMPCQTGERRFTTVSTWRTAHGAVEVGGRFPGLKHHEFRRMIELPVQIEGASLELALDIDPDDAADLRALLENGWRVRPAREVASTPEAFRAYVQGSFAELSIAQPVYTCSASGWFSDRTGAYLASGRPAVIQDTCIAGIVPTGEGILTFSSMAQAVEGMRRVLADPAGHCAAARNFAETHLDSDVVLGRLLETLGVP
jgi:hypothetical protein